MEVNKIYNENCLDTLKQMPDEFLDCCITSPPYWSLRDYGHPDQLGLEDTPDEFASKLADVFDEVRRCLKPTGTLWVNLGDSYYNYRGENNRRSDKDLSARNTIQRDCNNIDARPNELRQEGLKEKDLVGIPWMVAFELRRRGWWLRQDIIWAKPNPMPESVKDRCTKSHEYIFLLSKSAQYHFDHEAIQEPIAELSIARLAGNADGKFALSNLEHTNDSPYASQHDMSRKGRDRTVGNRNGLGASTLDHKNVQYDGQTPHSFHLSRLDGTPDEIYEMRNKRDVWNVTTKSFKDAHFATFPESLVYPMMLAGVPEGGLVYDPFFGAGTVGVVAHKLGRNWIGSELNPDYVAIAERRLEPYLAQGSLFAVTSNRG